MKSKKVLVVFFFLSYNLIFAQQTVVERVNQGLMKDIIAETAKHVASNLAIIASNNATRENLEEELEIRYGKTEYDRYGFFTGRGLSRTLVLGSTVNMVLSTSITSGNTPYFPPNKQRYFGKMNSATNVVYEGLGQNLLLLNHERMTQSSKNEYYQLRRKTLSNIVRQTQKSRRLLLLTAVYLAYKEGPDLIDALDDPFLAIN